MFDTGTHQSHVIEVAGRFVGAAIRQSGRFRFVAVDPRAEEMDGSTWASLPDVRRVASHLVTFRQSEFAPYGGGQLQSSGTHQFAVMSIHVALPQLTPILP